MTIFVYFVGCVLSDRAVFMKLNRETVHCALLNALYDAYQPKRVLCSARGSLVLRSCRFLLLLSLIFCQAIYANEDIAPRGGQNTKEKAVTKQLAQTCSTTEAKLAPAMVAIRSDQFSMGSPEDEKGVLILKARSMQLRFQTPLPSAAVKLPWGSSSSLFKKPIIALRLKKTAKVVMCGMLRKNKRNNCRSITGRILDLLKLTPIRWYAFPGMMPKPM